MAAKRTHELIPLCHPLPLSKVMVDCAIDEALPGVRVTAEVKVSGQTGVEMEALTAVSVACLTIYDMVKAADRAMRIEGIRLLRKSGGRSGTYEFRIDGEAFHLRVGDGEEGERVEARQGSAPDPDLVVIGDAKSFLAVASGRLSPEEAVESGALRAEGERKEDRQALLAWCQHMIGPTAA